MGNRRRSVYGGGCELAISCDFISAADDAVFGQPGAMVGLSAGAGSPVFLPRLLPPGRAMQMLMTGEPITVGERFRLPHSTLIASNLTDAERHVLLETFGNRYPLAGPPSPPVNRSPGRGAVGAQAPRSGAVSDAREARRPAA